ncbi:TonB family protein [Acetobacter sp.]|uniref:energy transducer TonB n=1 Tax=Acetobacter sp. TaxID=440 RepID=UPI0039EC4577
MKAMLSRSSPQRNRQEPRLAPQGQTEGQPHDAQPDAALPAHERESLKPSLTPVPRPLGRQYPRVKGTPTPLIRRELYAEPTLGPVLTSSAVAHFLLLTALLWQTTHHNPQGSPEGTQPPSVEMVFAAPQTSSGMTGQQSPDAGSGNAGKTASTAGQAEPNPEDAAPGPAVPSDDIPTAPELPTSSDGLPKPTPQEHKTVKPAHTPSGHKPNASSKSAAVPKAKPQPNKRRHAASPFDNPMDLSFNEAPAPRRHRTGRPGGSGGPIDMSVGPVVENGAINAHYTSRASIKGVSDDYGQQINEWIERHKFYPEEAARNGEEGPASVHVVLDRTGRVKSIYETGSSGSYYLDAATTSMFRGAQLPPVPPNMQGDHFDIDLTMNYILIRR